MELADILAASLETSHYNLTKVELMKWVEEDMHDTLRHALLADEFEPGLQIHAQVSFGAIFKDGPHYDTVKHVRPDFLIVDKGRYPLAFIDFLSVCHDPALDRLKEAVAKKADIAFIRIPKGAKFAEIKQHLREAGILARIEVPTRQMRAA